MPSPVWRWEPTRSNSSCQGFRSIEAYGNRDQFRQRAEGRRNAPTGAAGSRQSPLKRDVIRWKRPAPRWARWSPGTSMTAVALNGRSFTDLLALQPGIVPMSTQTARLDRDGGRVGRDRAFGRPEPRQSVDQRPARRRQRLHGQRRRRQGVDERRHVHRAQSRFDRRIPRSDQQFRRRSTATTAAALSTWSPNRDPTRCTAARSSSCATRISTRATSFRPERSFYRQNQFGGTVGGPIKKNKVFFFADYQGTRTNQGIDTGLISVPTLAERLRQFQRHRRQLDRRVSGPYIANLLSQKLGYGVSANEPYYTPGCTLQFAVRVSECDHSATGVVGAGPASAAIHPFAQRRTFHVFHRPERRDNVTTKAASAWTATPTAGALLSAYYFFDDYTVNNPYPTGQGGASVPGFNALNLGRGATGQSGRHQDVRRHRRERTAPELHADANNVGQPAGGVGPSLASQGFVTGVGTPGNRSAGAFDRRASRTSSSIRSSWGRRSRT
jgi:hypothetical protein